MGQRKGVVVILQEHQVNRRCCGFSVLSDPFPHFCSVNTKRLGEVDVTTKAEIRVRERCEDDKLLALKMEKGKNSQGIQATFSRCKS